ncbi:MAG: T9SS type A sorting domain-containing protein [Saprospiraceae bacterium]|nr:T9SS type A sorting domain-containing protein [Candidatus Opimibacter skivensis]
MLQLDQDGKSQYSHLISISNPNHTDLTGLSLYPNPSREGKLYIHCPQVDLQGGLIQLVDATGQVVRKLDFIQSGMELDISMMPSGVYLVCLTSNGQTLLKRLVIQ